MTTSFSKQIAAALHLSLWQVESVLQLLSEDASIPFISRYRKERTGSLDEVQIMAIRDENERLTALEKRRAAIIESIVEQGKMTPELQQKIDAVQTLSELEDLYLPYKPKRRTRATVAKEKGLEPLAKMLMAQHYGDVKNMAQRFVSTEKGVNSVEEALDGACDIIAEWVSEDAVVRNRIRNLFRRSAMLQSKAVKEVKGKKEDARKYADWNDWSEPAMKAPSHRILAIFRGENEGFLRLKIEPDADEAIAGIQRGYVRNDSEAAKYVARAVEDSYKRLVEPSVENEIRAEIKESADKKAIQIFGENLQQLLMAAPVGEKNVLAIDPGFRTGCKLVCLNRQGDLLHNETIYPHLNKDGKELSMHKLRALANMFHIEAIAIGNGTAGRETEDIIRKVRFDRDLIAVMVNESGASIYSTSDVARREFPNYDVTVRGAVSIGRRLQDPLSELVKIDPKSIGVGQYQHDVDQKALKQRLDDVVVSCVNVVGVHLNTAGRELLSYVSGMSGALAEKVIAYREANGAFKSRKELLKIPRFGAKTFEQAAGFLRIRDAENPLDNSSVHPESYHIVEKMAKDLNVDTKTLIANKELIAQIDVKRYITAEVGAPTLNDIIEELKRPGRDPRQDFAAMEFDDAIRSIADVKPGMTLQGIVSNITAFGAFVDIGVKTSGLVHVSQLRAGFVKNPSEVVSLNQKVTVKVLDVDMERDRISLTMRV
ncbi:MAG: RNA-binding transcriptional accessory protein [Bacteroidales bacterium]|nr:RNA-binding transcriptional accessory protein [Bacteroidales bacterium]